ncbi:hypothetical protein [Avrilella dinanensis]|uniref:DUF4258 domain-containing protein n=1 Tax=Avrilella dinanensis TaxID=2008672 RepID=A0A2M9R5P5_9FLAO|nr:hypothetical protein [Avrilella dinanensis]PJR04174.1 hypothetical protein CDL10_06285 [Avrilella dinanensis]
MKFSQRLAYYLLGLLIGSTIVFYFWGAKDTQFCYLPNCRVLKDLRSKPLIMTSEAKDAMEVFTTAQLTQYLTNGDVDFSQSNVPEDGGKKYVINAKDSLNNPLQIEMINYSERVKLVSIKYLDK